MGLGTAVRPAKRSSVIGLAIPLLSVSVLSWLYKNPFNGLAFLLVVAVILALGLRGPKKKVAAVIRPVG
jgi:hypothetical protein